MPKDQIITEDQLDLLHIIEKDGKASQRLISQNTGFSIGKVNYCLKALIDIGSSWLGGSSLEARGLLSSTNRCIVAKISSPSVDLEKKRG